MKVMEINGKAEDGEIKNMQQKNQSHPVMTMREVACLLNLHVNTVRRWSDMGILKAFRIGPRADRRFRRSDILTFLPKEDRGKSE
jgi:excisionase family DNA binding protein